MSMPVPSLEQLATAAVAARLAREPDAYLPRVVAAAPLSLVSPCLSGLRDPLALAAVEDAICDEEEKRREGKCASSSGREGLLEVHWRRLFLERFGGSSAPSETSRRGKECSDGASGTRWRHRFEAAEAAERQRLEALGARLREREREERERKRARSVVVLAAPPRPQAPKSGSSSLGNISETKKSSVEARQRIEKKLASGLRRRAVAATATAAKASAPSTTAAAAAAAAAAARPPSSSSFPNLARPLVRPGNEAQRRIVRKGGTSSGSGGGRVAASKAVVARSQVFREFEEVSLFD